AEQSHQPVRTWKGRLLGDRRKLRVLKAGKLEGILRADRLTVPAEDALSRVDDLYGPVCLL
ncbi:MAG: hypothetical protein AABY92_10950, partial [Thermodesulfobacteriota bacterium]